MRSIQTIVLLALAVLGLSSPTPRYDNSHLDGRSATTTTTTASALPSPTCSAITPPPAGHLCGAPGIYHPESTDAVIAEKQKTSLATCRDFCLHRSPSDNDPVYSYSNFCLRFTYNTASKVCQLRNSNSTKEYSMDQSSTTLFYDKECFQCKPECPQSTSINLIDNGGFELSQQYIGPWYLYPPEARSKVKIVSPGYNSSRAFLFPASDYQTSYSLGQRRNLCSGTFYTFKANIKSVPVNGSTTLKAASITLTENSGFSYTAGYAATDNWETLFWTFQIGTSPDTSFFRIDIFPNDFDVYFDNIEVLVAPTSFKTTGSSIVTNGGFESGSLKPWHFMNANDYDPHRGHRAVTSPGLTQGKYKFQFSSYGYDVGHGYTYTGVELSQPLDTEPGLKYLLTFDYLYHGRPGDDSSYLSYSSFISFGNTSWSQDVMRNTTVHFSRAATAEDTLTKLTLGFAVSDAGEDHMGVQIDNVKVKALVQ